MRTILFYTIFATLLCYEARADEIEIRVMSGYVTCEEDGTPTCHGNSCLGSIAEHKERCATSAVTNGRLAKCPQDRRLVFAGSKEPPGVFVAKCAKDLTDPE